MDIAQTKFIDKLMESNSFLCLFEYVNSCAEESFSIWVSLIQIHGIKSYDVLVKRQHAGRQGEVRFEDYTLLIERKNIRVSSSFKSPFVIREGHVWLEDVGVVISINCVIKNDSKRIEGVYFPHQGGEVDRSAIRLNPRNLGKCAGGCLFCQRAYQIPTNEEKSNRFFYSVDELIAQVVSVVGAKGISSIKHCLLVTEFFNDNKHFLEYCTQVKKKLKERGFKGQFSTLAQELKTEDEIDLLYDITDGYDYCSTLECFENRKGVMSKAKGIPLEQLYSTLYLAKQRGFRHVFINYMSGLDSIETVEKEFKKLSQENLIDSVGLNMFTSYTDLQESLKNEKANTLTYHFSVLSLIKRFGVKIYNPDLYERFPFIGYVMGIDFVNTNGLSVSAP